MESTQTEIGVTMPDSDLRGSLSTNPADFESNAAKKSDLIKIHEHLPAAEKVSRTD